MMNAFRNLYQITSEGVLVAFITATDADKAQAAYVDNGGKCRPIRIERLTYGAPNDVLKIYH